jgi:hypothetical protein
MRVNDVAAFVAPSAQVASAQVPDAPARQQ